MDCSNNSRSNRSTAICALYSTKFLSFEMIEQKLVFDIERPTIKKIDRQRNWICVWNFVSHLLSSDQTAIRMNLCLSNVFTVLRNRFRMPIYNMNSLVKTMDKSKKCNKEGKRSLFSKKTYGFSFLGCKKVFY